MRLRSVLAIAGAGLGAALTVSAAAAADTGGDAVEAAWPFPDFDLPGAATAHDQVTIAPFTTQMELHYVLPPDVLDYTTENTQFSIPFLADATHQVVTASTGDFPPVGTVVDQFGPLFVNTYIDVPDVGFGDQFSFLTLANTYISDTAGTADVISAFGHDITLFDFPATSAADGADLAGMLDALL